MVERRDSTYAHPRASECLWLTQVQRYISFLPTIFFGANLQATWESVAVSFQAGLLNGGPTSLIYGTIIAVIGSLALAASMAEMASM